MLHFRHIARADRPTILYLHGFLGSGNDWNETVELLGDDFAHLMVDLPGHGDSTALFDHAYSMSGCAEAVVEVLRDLNLSRCLLVGYSMGGRLGIHLATHYPELFERAIIESGSPGLKKATEREERIRRDSELAGAMESEPFDTFLKFWYQQPLFASIDQPSRRFAELIALRLKGIPSELARSLVGMGTGAQSSLWDHLPSLPMPVCFLAGEKDNKFTRLAAQMAHLCPEGELAILATAGHTVHYEQPEMFAAQVRSFFTGRS